MRTLRKTTCIFYAAGGTNFAERELFIIGGITRKKIKII